MYLDKIEKYAKIIGVAVACFGVFKYYQSLDQDRVNRSLSYYDQFHSGRVFDARIEIGKLSYNWLNAKKADGSKLTGEELSKLILTDLSASPVAVQYDVIIEFFQMFERCVDMKGCDRKTAISLLSEEARNLTVYLAPKISDRRNVGDASSEALLCFASEFSSKFC